MLVPLCLSRMVSLFYIIRRRIIKLYLFSYILVEPVGMYSVNCTDTINLSDSSISVSCSAANGNVAMLTCIYDNRSIEDCSKDISIDEIAL